MDEQGKGHQELLHPGMHLRSGPVKKLFKALLAVGLEQPALAGNLCGSGSDFVRRAVSRDEMVVLLGSQATLQIVRHFIIGVYRAW